MNIPRLSALSLAVSLALGAGAAHAVLERVGPTSVAPSIGGFPAWYQDTTGLALEFCDPKNQAELDGGWCLLLPGDVAAVPEVFPGNFFDEHFWFAAGAGMDPASGGKALLTLAVEAAFAADVVPGGQVAFSRIRVVLNPVPVTGTYRIIHPYGEETVHAVAGERIFITDDVGINCPPGQFDCATQSRLGPFLLPANSPGGGELPAVAGPVSGKLYIADPARIGPVTGSALPDFTDSTGAVRNHNIFRIEGPAGSRLGIDPATGLAVDYIETTDFSLMGRVFTGSLPSRVDVERASYGRDATAQRVDVFATAFQTTQTRVPAQPRPQSVAPQLSFFAAPCAGTADPVTGVVLPPYSAPVGATETQMFSTSPGLHWGQVQPASIPAAICVKDAAARDAAGNVVPAYIQHQVTDEVTVSQAYYDRANGTLTVSATSSDAVVPPQMTMAFGSYRGDLVGGQVQVSGLIAPPNQVRVFSAAGGTSALPVTTSLGGGAPVGLAVAANDTFAFAEDAGAQLLDILGNDSNVAGGTVTLTALPLLGTATVNADGSVTYTPNANVNGSDQFMYTVSVGTQTSNTATVTLNMAPVNDAPVAVNDSANAVAGLALAINVLANDTDVDGKADLFGATLVTGPAAGATVTGGTGGIFDFVASAPGTYSFTYTAQDVAGASSASAATVTVTVAAAETVSITRAEYVVSKGRLRASGTISPAASQTITLAFLNSAGAVVGSAGTAVAGALGNWAIDAAMPLPAGASRLRATSSNGTVRVQNLSIK